MVRFTRRSFLRSSARAVGAGIVMPYVITSRALGDATTPPASERITMGHIGVGGRGGGLLGTFLALPGAQCVAVSDCFRSRVAAAADAINAHYASDTASGTFSGCKAYPDFQDLLADDGVDAVVIATHDVWHVPLTTAAARVGKHVYVEKPLGMSIGQDIAAREVVQRYGVVFQYGTQQRSMGHCRQGCGIVRRGLLGEIEAIEVVAPAGYAGGSTVPIPVPEDLDYDRWLGPAPWSPYTETRCTDRGGFFVYDNSIGFLAGWGSHPLDILDWAYGSDECVPVECSGTGVIPTEGLYNTVATWDLNLRYANGVPFHFASGPEDSTKFWGSEGFVDIRRSGLRAEPESLLAVPASPDEKGLPISANHSQDFLDAIRMRRPAISPIESAVRSDTISHLGDIAIRTGRKITWDAERETIVGDESARRMMHRPMRPPWRL